MANSNLAAAQELLDQHPSEAAYYELEQEIAAVPESDQPHINIDVLEVVTLVLGVLPKIRGLREQIARELPHFNLAEFDKLEKLTLALSHAHTRWRASTRAKAEIPQLVSELEALRARLLVTAQALAANGLLEGDRLKECKGSLGYRDIASDVLTLVNIMKESWPNIEGKTPLSREALNAAASQAVDLLSAVGLKDQTFAGSTEAARMRRKAFTLFRAVYERVQRAAYYLLGEEGAEEVAPSLYSGRGGRRPLSASPVTDSNGAASNSSAAPTAESSAQSGEQPSAQSFTVDNRAGLPITHPLES